MRYFIETSKGTVGINIDSRGRLDKRCGEFLSNILSQIYEIDGSDSFEIEETLEGKFLMINLKDRSLGRPEYKIRERFIAQELDIEMDENYIAWYSWCSIS